MASRSTLRSALAAPDVNLLEQAVATETPELRSLLELPLVQLSANDLNELRDAVAVLLLRRGFGPDWEPNEFGLECEKLIDRLAPWHWTTDS